MRKVIVCKDEPKETICHTGVDMMEMIVVKIWDEYYQLSAFPHNSNCYWKELGNLYYNRGPCQGFDSPEEAILYMVELDKKVYSFKNLDEFIQFYQEKK